MFRFRRLAAVALFLCVCLSVLSVSAVDLEDDIPFPTDGEVVYQADGDLGELVGVEAYSLSPITASSANGFKAVMLELLGDYDPVLFEYKYQVSNQSYYNYLREVQLDYPWLVSAAVFSIVLFCILRGWGAWLCRK